jgi:hypothetical protein
MDLGATVGEQKSAAAVVVLVANPVLEAGLVPAADRALALV